MERSGYGTDMSVDEKPATIDDLLGLPPDRAYEILGGEIVEKSGPSGEHGAVQLGVGTEVGIACSRRSEATDSALYWWFATEVDIALSPHDIVRPDLVGWRRSRVPKRPKGFPVNELPDWVCEVLSPSTARRDLGQKQRIYHRHRVPWLWYADPQTHLLQVLRWTEQGYLIADTAEPGDVRVIAPFEGVDLDVARMFGVEDDED